MSSEANPPRDAALSESADLKGSENISHKEGTVTDAISSKLNAIRTEANLIVHGENTEGVLNAHEEKSQDTFSCVHVSVCPCGETECVEVHCIRICLLKSKIDQELLLKFLRMALLYLDLAEAYAANFEADKVLNSIRLGCRLFASLHANADEGIFISYKEFSSSEGKLSKRTKTYSNYYRFWAKAWSLAAEVYTGFLEITVPVAALHQENTSSSKVSASNKEVKMTVEKFCNICSMRNCYCDRLTSGQSTSSSSVLGQSKPYGRKLTKKSNPKSLHRSPTQSPGVDAHVPSNVKDTGSFEGIYSQSRNEDINSPTTQPTAPILSEYMAPHSLNLKISRIFKFLENSGESDPEDVLCDAINFFDEAKKVLRQFPDSSMELKRFAYWKAHVHSILGKSKLNKRDSKGGGAKDAFEDAIKACQEADNIVGVAMNTFWLGQCKRQDIDQFESYLEHSRKQGLLSEMKFLELLCGSKSDYTQYLSYLTDAYSKIDAVKSSDPEKNKVRAIILYDLGLTYMNLATVLARTRTDLECSGREMKILFINVNPPSEKEVKRGAKNRKISAGDVILEGAKIFESMGEGANYHVAEAYRQLAVYLRCCFNDLSTKSHCGNKVKQQACLVKEKLEMSMHLLDPQEYPSEYLKILIEKVAFSSSLPGSLLSNPSNQESSSLSLLLEGRKAAGAVKRDAGTESEFLTMLQSQLKKMLKSNDEKIKKLYLMSLKPDGDFMSQLENMYHIWKA